MTTSDRCYAGPLAGIEVLDFGHYFAAPMAAMLLAEQGANVTRIVAPGPRELPDPQFRLLNRNKRIVEIDLKSEAGRDAARKLAEAADITVESYRPGVMARLGLDHASLSPVNPGLISLSLPGFPSTDTRRAALPGWEGVVSAAAGLYTNGLRQALRFAPLYAPLPACSAFASMHGAIAVVSALLARERTGLGTSIEAPLVDAGISCNARSFVYKGAGLRAAASADRSVPKPLESLVIEPDDDAQTRRRKVDGLSKMMPPIYTTRHYVCADGRRILAMPIKPEMADRFFAALGLQEQLVKEGFVNESPWEAFDSGQGNNIASSWTMSRENSIHLIELIGKAISTRPAEYWESTLGALGIPIAVFRSRDEWLGIESLQRAGLLTEMDDGRDRIVVPGRVADISGPGGALLDVSPREPECVDLEDLLATRVPRSATGASASASAVEKADLLSGLRVLDLCNVVAGPNAAYTMAQYGAEVIRLEPPKSFNLPMHLEWTLEVNQGKRSMVVDQRTAPGQDVLQRLVRWADVVVHNRLDDVAIRLGLSYEQLHEINPDAVVCQNSAYGGTFRSEWDRIPGYDPMPNMATGLDHLAGSSDEPRAMTEIFGDLMSGLGTAWSAVLGVWQRQRTGFAGEGRSSLVRAAHFYQLPYMIGSNGQSDWGQGRGPDARGDRWWQRMYACRDGWIFVGTHESRASALAHAVAGHAGAGEEELETAFAAHDVEHWVSALTLLDIGVHEVMSVDDLCEPEGLRPVDNAIADECAEGPLRVLRWPEHPSGLPVVLPSPTWVRVGPQSSFRRLSPAPKVGQHTREILAELGYSEDEIGRLYRLRVAHDFLPAIGNSDDYFFKQRKVGAS